MKHITNESLIEKQISFWDDDFYWTGDSITKTPELVSISDINYDPNLEQSYKDEENQGMIAEFKALIKNSSPLPPLLLDSSNNLIDGYHRLFAFKALKVPSVLVIRLNRESKGF